MIGDADHATCVGVPGASRLGVGCHELSSRVEENQAAGGGHHTGKGSSPGPGTGWSSGLRQSANRAPTFYAGGHIRSDADGGVGHRRSLSGHNVEGPVSGLIMTPASSFRHEHPDRSSRRALWAHSAAAPGGRSAPIPFLRSASWATGGGSSLRRPRLSTCEECVAIGLCDQLVDGLHSASVKTTGWFGVPISPTVRLCGEVAVIHPRILNGLNAGSVQGTDCRPGDCCRESGAGSGQPVEQVGSGS